MRYISTLCSNIVFNPKIIDGEFHEMGNLLDKFLQANLIWLEVPLFTREKNDELI